MIFGLNFDNIGGAKLQKELSTTNNINQNNTIWLHLDANSHETKEFIEQKLSHIDPHIKKAVLAEQTRPRYVQFENGFLLILRGVNLNQNQSPEDMISLRIWVEENRIISFQKRNLQTISDLEKILLEGNGPKNISEFIQKIIELISNKFNEKFSIRDDSDYDL